MMKKFTKTILSMVLAFSSVLCVACDNGAGEDEPEYFVPQKETVADETAAKIRTSYKYKVVAVNSNFVLPDVEFTEYNVTATYKIDGQDVLPGAVHTFTEVGMKEMIITAKDASNNISTPVKVHFEVVEADNALAFNKIYAFDTIAGLEGHVYDSGINGLRIRFWDLENEDDVTSVDNIPVVKDEDGNVISKSFITIKNYTNFPRLALDDPLHYNWDQKFGQIYFYAYNPCLEADVGDINIGMFQGKVHAFDGEERAGWQKIIIAPKEMTGDDPMTAEVEGEDHTYIVTDYSKFTSVPEVGSYPSTGYEGMIDLADCKGLFIRFGFDYIFKTMAISAIYGEPFVVPEADEA